MFKLMNRQRNKKGFTLIELIVVVAILGILALVAIPRFANVRENSENQAMLATATSILNAAEIRYQDDAGFITITEAAGYSPDIDTDLVTPKYLREGDYEDYTLNHIGNGEFEVTYTNASDDSITVPVPASP